MAKTNTTIDMVAIQNEDIDCPDSNIAYGSKFAVGNSDAFSGIFFMEGTAPKVDITYQISFDRSPEDDLWTDSGDILLGDFTSDDPVPAAIIPTLAVWMRLKIVPKIGNGKNSIAHTQLAKRKIK